jgi:hypothetical protein
MPRFSYGIGGFTSSLRKALDDAKNSISVSKEIEEFRVRDIILDESHPQFERYGGWSAIGLIFIEKVTQPTGEEIPALFAYPLSPNGKYYPLLNEIVIVLTLSDSQIESSNTSTKLYYLPPTNIWGSQHHNAIPGSSELAPSQQKDYEQTSVGSVRRITDGGTEIDLGSTFIEQSNINPLKPFEGDYIIEGRFGNSLRFGSSDGEYPITKIRNGQGEITDEGWVTIEENINEDSASVYLTSTQQVNLQPNTFNYNSYTIAPEAIPEYLSPQVLINSGRLVFNAKEDSVLISSAKSIGLNSQDSVNIDSQNSFVVNSPNILLGDKNATEPLLKGDTTIELLSELVDEMRKWVTQFNSNPSPYLSYLKASSTPLIATLVKLKVDLETKTKSKVSKTI